jgi:hypothetical protein
MLGDPMVVYYANHVRKSDDAMPNNDVGASEENYSNYSAF